jgi:hypothetical protein
MKNLVIGTIAMLFIAGTTCAADTSLWDKLVDVAIQHIKETGPDKETGQFISMARGHAWSRRQEFVDLVVPHLKGKHPENVAGAIRVLSWLRWYAPMSSLGSFEERHRDFFVNIDKIMYGQIEHFHSLESDQVYHSLALYLGSSRTDDAKRHLLKIAKSPIAKSAKEQALICLTFHRDPKDMEKLLPFMLEDSRASGSLPYHFRNSYGEASVPYLKKTLLEAKSAGTRLGAAIELVHLRIPDGFRYLHKIALLDPEPEGKRGRHLARIRQFAVDYLELPRSDSSKHAIAAHIEKKQGELCKTER